MKTIKRAIPPSELNELARQHMIQLAAVRAYRENSRWLRWRGEKAKEAKPRKKRRV